MEQQKLTWIQTSLGYELALEQEKLLCKNVKGKLVKTIPKKVKNLPEVQEILAFSQWCTQHAKQAQEKIQKWMQRQLPIPVDMLKNLWLDFLWQKSLENLVVAPIKENKVILEECGFLKNISEKGAGVVNVDGDTCWLESDFIVIPHPVLLPNLSELRELATDLNMKQDVLQIFREIWTITEENNQEAKEISTFKNGYFERLGHAFDRCRALGYKVSGGYAICPVWEQQMIEAQFWIGSDRPENESYTGELIWVNEAGESLKLKNVGAIAFSEGIRLANAIFAKCKKEQEPEFTLPLPAKENSHPPATDTYGY